LESNIIIFHSLGNTAEYFDLVKVVGVVALSGIATPVAGSTVSVANSNPMTAETELVGRMSVDSQHTAVATWVVAVVGEKTACVTGFAATELEEPPAVKKN